MLRAIIRAGLAMAMLASSAAAYQPPMLIEAFHDGASGLRTPGWLDASQSDPAHARALLESDLARTAEDEGDAEGDDDPTTEIDDERPSQAPKAVRLTADQIRKDTPVSLGKASSGWLINGRALASNERILSRPGRNFGTPEMVQAIERAVDEVHRKFPKSPQLGLGDLSKEGGGPFRPHKSHQSGRDADIAFYTKTVGQASVMRATNRGTIDVARTFTLMRSWLEREEVEYLFVDYRLQKPLYEYARDKARVPQDKLDAWFQYPKGRGARGVVRHLNGHGDHMHVRFYAPESTSAAHAYIEKFGASVLKPLPRHYKVRKGDSLIRIAKKQKVSVKDLLRWNHMRPKQAKRLKPGASLVVGWQRPRLPKPGK